MGYQEWIQRQLTKAKRPEFVQSRFDGDVGQAFMMMSMLAGKVGQLPPAGTVERDKRLRDVWLEEPLLAGVIYTIVSRVATTAWKVTGKPRLAQQATEMLLSAGEGAGWDTELKRWVRCFLTQDRGALFEKGRTSKNGPVTGLAYLDIANCRFRGESGFPPGTDGDLVYYTSAGRVVPLRSRDVVHRTSMPSDVEATHWTGVSLVSRAIRTISLLLALHKYEEDALDDMPPEGIAAVTGMNQQQVKDALDLWKANRGSRDLTFKKLLWLASNNEMGPGVDVKWVPFSEPPASFTRKDVVETYVKTLSACAGVDAGEFWLFTHTGSTKAVGEVQHLKGQGKGVGEILRILERALNYEVLPEGAEFVFDEQDDAGDLHRAQLAGAWGDYVTKLWSPPQGMETGLLPKEVALRILARENCLTEEELDAAVIVPQETEETVTDVSSEAPEETKAADYEELPEWRKRQIVASIRSWNEAFGSLLDRKAERLLGEKGGPGSGNWGHEGRPGHRGGSRPGGGIHRNPAGHAAAVAAPRGTAFGRATEVATSKKLGGGINYSYVVGLAGDGSGVYKDADNAYGHNANNEIAAYRVAKMLNPDDPVVPETKELTFQGNKGTVQYFVENAKVADYVDNLEKSLKDNRSRAEDMLALDIVMGNGDRHGGNYIFDSKGKLWAIDHGHADNGRKIVSGKNVVALWVRYPASNRREFAQFTPEKLARWKGITEKQFKQSVGKLTLVSKSPKKHDVDAMWDNFQNMIQVGGFNLYTEGGSSYADSF